MIREGKYIHITSVDQARDVMEYYRQIGIEARGLTINNCLTYPYFGLYKDDDNTDILIGWNSIPGGSSDVVSYVDWFSTNCVTYKMIDEADIAQAALELFDGL